MRRFGVDVERRDDGTTILRCPEPLGTVPASLVVLLRERAAAHPDRDFLCERDGNGAWRRATYADVLNGANAVAQRLLDGGHGPDRPLAILSDNSINQAIMMFGAMTVGVPRLFVDEPGSRKAQHRDRAQRSVRHFCR
jgi:feruloyl-CoA synthase